MKIARHTDKDFAAKLRAAASDSSLFDAEIEQRTKAILHDVFVRGDDAVLDFTEKFDGATLSAEQLAVTQAELMAASLTADEALRAAVTEAEANIASFARKSKRKDWSGKNSHGANVGEKFDPFQRVGVYIPGGTAPLVSTALMTITLAKVAGCQEIVVTTPCGRDGSINPAILFAARAAGATEIYRVGGAQAIAALAYGTKTIRRVQKIFGPGNAYVSMAKRLLVGRVAIDLLAGPSDLLVIADDTANPKFAAADLLAQAEHGSGHERVWLVTTSAKILKAVEKEISKQLPKLPRREFIQRVLDRNTWLIQVATVADAVALANQLAPEHCEVITRDARRVSGGIVTAGAIFLGNWSPTVLGDYVAGPSHVLPTDGAGASFAGLTVDQFQRRTSVVEYRPRVAQAGVEVGEKIRGTRRPRRAWEIGRNSICHMSQLPIKPSQKLEIQFKKWLNKGYLHNVVLHPTYSRSGLPPQEEFLVDVIDKGGRSIPFTESGFLAPERGFIRYAEVKRVHWISKNRAGFNPEDKREVFDRLEFELSDSSTLLLQDLDQAVFPLLKFFEWLQGGNKS